MRRPWHTRGCCTVERKNVRKKERKEKISMNI
jgi:hypothetical protein